MTAYVVFIGRTELGMTYGSAEVHFPSPNPTAADIMAMGEKIGAGEGIDGCVILNIIPVSESED